MNPFKVEGPACISFSGGRTSAYMLHQIIEAHGGQLPPDLVVCFANTGREHEETLRFVAECAARWSVPITWIERADGDGFRVVSYDDAKRDGEPFEALIRHRRYLPNPVTRFCTAELKIRPMHKFLRSLGWTEWDQCIGIRADEQRRVAKIRARGRSTESADETMRMPLADAGVTVGDVGAFWSAQGWGLALESVNGRTLLGNCDLCFLKPWAQRLSIIAAEPNRAVWWARMEEVATDIGAKESGARFCKGHEPGYAEMKRFALTQGDAFGYMAEDEGMACFCGD